VAWFKDYLLVADTAGGKITKVDSEGPSMFREDAHVSAITADAEFRVYLADARNHRLIRIDKKGKEECPCRADPVRGLHREHVKP